MLSYEALVVAQAIDWFISNLGIYFFRSTLPKLKCLIQFQLESTIQCSHDLKLDLIQNYDMPLL